MKNIFLIVSLIVIPILLAAQNRTDKWVLGTACYDTLVPRPLINFSNGIADTFSLNRNKGFFITNTSICDTAGNLLLYTNGVNIFNANHDTLLNSVGFNPGYISTINCNLLAYVQGVIIIPKPGHDSIFSLFHLGGEEFYVYNYYHVQPLDFRYTEINIKQDNGKGAVDLNIKTKPIVVDTLVKGFITAVRHGNGRDWWIIVPRYFSNLYYKFLLTPDSLLGPYTQNIGKEAYRDPGGGAVFSNDGSVYAQVMEDNRLNIYKFDRCTGLFYDSIFIQVPNVSQTFYEDAQGVAISPNNKFLYVVTYTKIYQYDLQATNIAASQIQVAEWDSSNNPVPTIFFTAQLAPDNKIYIGTFGGCNTLHYIDQPDSPGTACNVVQNSFPLSLWNVSVPYFPNYDLGVLPGSPCDTLGLGLHSTLGEELSISVSPNPANSIANFVYHLPANKHVTLTIYDGYGHVVAKQNLYGTSRNFVLHTGKFANGLYYWSVQNEQVRVSGKLVILH